MSAKDDERAVGRGETITDILAHDDGKFWFQKPHLLRLNLLLCVPLLSSAISGYDGSLMNGLQSLERWTADFDDPSGALLGTVVAAQSIGGLVALPFVGDLCDRLGRKPMLVAGILIICASSVIQCFAVNLAMFIVARLLVGFGGMFSAQPSPMLIAELAYPSHRGKYTSLYWTMYYLGSILSSWATFGTQDISSSWAWRLPSLLQMAYPVLQLVFLWWVPESPRFLVAKGKRKEATALLQRIHAGETDPSVEPSSLVALELAEITQAIEMEKAAQQTSWSSLVATPGNRKRTIIVVCVGAFAQWNGIAVVSYFLNSVLDSIGISDSYTKTLINGVLQIFNFAASVAAAFMVDRLGRRTLFIWSSIGMLVSFIVWTACSAVNSETGSKQAGIVVVACVFLVYFHYDIAWTPLLFGYTTEIMPYSLRSKGLAAELVSVYSSLIIASYCNPIGLDNLGWRYYIVFCCILVVITTTCYFYFPETKGYSLEEIAVVFDGANAESVQADTLSLAEDKNRSSRDGKGAHVEYTSKSKDGTTTESVE